MNQDQVKELLLALDRNVPVFTVIFSGKQSGKVDGLYYPDRQEIIIHNKNFTDDGQLVYTAIHEFAHHIQHARSPVPISTRAHTNAFWDILHKLLFSAEEKGLYANVFKKDGRFTSLTKKIRGEYLQANGSLMKELGSLLEQAHALCLELNLSFEDYVDRELLLHRSAARVLMKMSAMNLNPKIGYENMKTVAGIKDDAARARAEEAFSEGMTSDMVKAEIQSQKRPGDAINVLLEERDKIERSIDTLTKKLAKVERRLQELKFEDRNRVKK